MKKKNTAEKPEQTLERPRRREIDEVALILSMRRLLQNEDFKVLRGMWLKERYDLLESGKAKMEPQLWAELRGFDRAIMEPGKWAAKETNDDKNGKQSEFLREILAGATEKRK